MPTPDTPSGAAYDARRRRLTYLAVGLFYGLIAAFVALLLFAGDLMATRIVSWLKVGYVVGACVFIGVWVVVYGYSRIRVVKPRVLDAQRRDVSSP
jgi:uncharacterized membrane protein (DUF485 family)